MESESSVTYAPGKTSATAHSEATVSPPAGGRIRCPVVTAVRSCSDDKCARTSGTPTLKVSSGLFWLAAGCPTCSWLHPPSCQRHLRLSEPDVVETRNDGEVVPDV